VVCRNGWLGLDSNWLFFVPTIVLTKVGELQKELTAVVAFEYVVLLMNDGERWRLVEW
jgi:hypothetical protein